MPHKQFNLHTCMPCFSLGTSLMSITTGTVCDTSRAAWTRTLFPHCWLAVRTTIFSPHDQLFLCSESLVGCALKPTQSHATYRDSVSDEACVVCTHSLKLPIIYFNLQAQSEQQPYRLEFKWRARKTPCRGRGRHVLCRRVGDDFRSLPLRKG